MGNKLCKKKTDPVDNPKSEKSTPFDRIINRLHLRPSSWKSESQLNEKRVNRYNLSPNDVNNKENITKIHPLSKSSDWTDVALEVPEKEEPIHLRNPKLALIFSHDDAAPTPPPRKHKKGIREKLESVAKNGLQAFQSKKPVEEPLCVKKTVNPTCPLDDHDCAIHNRNHKSELRQLNNTNENNNNNNNKKEKDGSITPKPSTKLLNKDIKRRKNLSVVSLPNYNELKLTVATFDDIDKKPDQANRNSLISLPNESKKPLTSSTGKLETYMTRCRSFGSLLPQQIRDKLRIRKIPTDNESDDSFGALEDWDLRIIEHYNPKDASLPRPRKIQKDDKEILSEIENLIVKGEEGDGKPVPPVRRSESLLKKASKTQTDASNNPKSPPNTNKLRSDDMNSLKIETNLSSRNPINTTGKQSDVVEHSSLMKILQEFSMKDKQKNLAEKETLANDIVKGDENNCKLNSNFSSLTPSLVEFERNITSVEDFINAEKSFIENDLPVRQNDQKKIVVT